MTAETYTVHFTLDPALRAYLEWLDEDGLAFSPAGFDLFAAGYRARVAEEAAGPRQDAPGAEEIIREHDRRSR